MYIERCKHGSGRGLNKPTAAIQQGGSFLLYLIKGYGWYDNESGEILVGSNGMMDVTANGMFEAASVKGTIDTIPEVPGLAVWQNGHIGIYIGNGEVIEAMGTQYGVVKTTLPDNWTHWLQIPYIAYAE